MKTLNLIITFVFLGIINLYAGDSHAPCGTPPPPPHTHIGDSLAYCYGYAMVQSFNRDWNHPVCPAHSFPGDAIDANYFSSEAYNVQNVQPTDILTFSNDHLEKGFHSVEWNGRNQTGQAVSSGL
jgi:hypothetical protein